MAPWQQRQDLWCLEPSGAERGLIEFIGGSYLAASPQLSYRRLLEELGGRGWRIHAWSYVPGFDHQRQANEAWRSFRLARRQWDRSSEHPCRPLRLGHSLGCKLQLLAPDGGRGAQGLVALSFNNYSAERSVPMLAELGRTFGFQSEFSPSPPKTLREIQQNYRQPYNLLIRFTSDHLDQSTALHSILQSRDLDQSRLVTLPGDHLTPSSAGIRRQFLGEWADSQERKRQVAQLADLVDFMI